MLEARKDKASKEAPFTLATKQKLVFGFGAKICFEIQNFIYFSCGRTAFDEITQFVAKIAVLKPLFFSIHKFGQIVITL